jgi:hypothetical protein
VADANRRAARPAGDVTPKGEATAAPAEAATEQFGKRRPD